jgi:hypothetical protein
MHGKHTCCALAASKGFAVKTMVMLGFKHTATDSTVGTSQQPQQ